MNLFVFFAITLLTLPSFASDSSQNEDEQELSKKRLTALSNLSLDELMDIPITSASRVEEKISDTPANVIVITREQIETRRYTSLSDLMRDLPGVQFQDRSNQILYHVVTFRGHLLSNKFLILQDGIRIDSPTGESLPLAENFPLYHAKQVEIVYGPASAVYGTDAFGGVINIITENPKEIDGGKIGVTAGNHDYHYAYAYAGKKLNDQVSISIGAHQHHFNDKDLANDYPNLFQMTNLTNSNGQLVENAKDRSPFTAPAKSESFYSKLALTDHLTIGYQRNILRNPSTTGEPPKITPYGEDLIWETITDNLYAKYHHYFNEQLNGTTQIEYSGYEIGEESKFRNRYCEYISCYLYAKGTKESIEQQLHFKIDDVHQLTGGLSYAHYYSIPKTTDLPIPYNTSLSPSQQNLYHMGTNNTLPIDIIELRYHTRAIYLQLQSAWDKQWSSTIGLRYDYNSRYGETFNPRVGLVYRLNPRTIFKLLYGEAFRAPSAMDSYETYGIFTGKQNANGEYLSSSFKVPNPNLQPEKAKSLEFNILHRIDEHLNVVLNTYYTKANNLILTMSDPVAQQFIEGGQLLNTKSNYNTGRSHRLGLELALNGTYLLLNHNLKLDWWASYSYLQGKSTYPGFNIELNLPYASTNLFKFGTTLKYKNQYFATLQMRSNGTINMLPASTKTPTVHIDTPGSAVFDLHLGSNIYKNLSANIDIYNLFDTHYYAANTNYPNNAIPQTLRSWMFSLNYRF
jgi:outer membrane receptor protein involved in Fe transport